MLAEEESKRQAQLDQGSELGEPVEQPIEEQTEDGDNEERDKKGGKEKAPRKVRNNNIVYKIKRYSHFYCSAPLGTRQARRRRGSAEDGYRSPWGEAQEARSLCGRSASIRIRS